MKRIMLSILAIGAAVSGWCQQTETDSITALEPVEVRAVRAAAKAPFAKTNMSAAEIEKRNTGRDLPFILQFTPSVVAYSDAGNGVGYTGLRIRGTDATRINVTLNGIPFNDAESQGTFFVDLPDFASSVNSIQIQRGVGTSTNGAGSFGGTINLSTNELNKEAYLELNNNYGSFNTWKNTVRLGSGLIGGKFSTDLRLSRISSDGYIDRASSDLQSVYLSTAWYGEKSSLRFNYFSGKETTYQAWYGVAEADLKDNRTVNYAGTEKPGDPYSDEHDRYKQDHFQLFYRFNNQKGLEWSTALFHTRGNGYYEQYKADETYADYGLPNPVYGNETIENTDLIRRLGLDNDLYGTIFSLQHTGGNNIFTAGGGWSRYEGLHEGEVIWAEQGLTQLGNWYANDAWKNDLNLYFKHLLKFNEAWSLFYDFQYRRVRYVIHGFRDNPEIDTDNTYNFLNPKIGVSYSNNGWQGFASYSKAGKEPNRDDFEAGGTASPKPEYLDDFELGIGKSSGIVSWMAGFYFMNYKDQLVLTGKINDVGAYTRTNIPESFRLGVELQASIRTGNKFAVAGNLTLSRNRALNFTEFVDDYDNGGQHAFFYASTDLAFSPSVTAAIIPSWRPIEGLELSAPANYVGSQYMDNTSNENRKLDAFYRQDLRGAYSFKYAWLKDATVFVQAFNILNAMYEPNGYTFSYFYGGELVTENYYFPMAGTNFSVGLNVRL